MTARRLAGAALALVVLALASCAPIAQVIADGIERNDGASLTYVEWPGLAFDPGPSPARGVIVRAEGDDLALLFVPDGATCTVTATQLDCRLGTVTEVTTVGVSGRGVVANATWRRVGPTVFLTFARLPGEEGP